MDDVVNERAVIGGNNPPPETLAELFSELLQDVDEVAAAGTKLPVQIGSDEEVSAYAGVVNRTRRMIDFIDALRKQQNDPHRRAMETINAFFNALGDRLKRMKVTLEDRTTAYNNQKAADERRRRAEEAARLKEEADRRLAEAAQAPTGIEAEIAQENAERAATLAARAATNASGSDADMSRVRTAGGTVTTRTVLVGRVIDNKYENLDLNDLRAFIGVEVLDKAINAYVRLHKKTKPLKGVEIFETSKASFRG